ncbi:MAG: nitrate reductase [Halioglobus sp.]|nr:nitrate reductase [Halioglobus sp.]
MQRCSTTCPYCGVGCGVVAAYDSAGDDVRSVSVSGEKNHPANAGRLCVKGTALAETLSTQGRLLYPRLGGRQLHWDAALDEVAQRLRDTRREHGPQSIAFYLSGQLLTEDYYVANKLMKGFLGSANVDTNSRLCMSSAVAAYQRAFGEDVVPCNYQDLESCDLLVMVGSNAAWTHPVLYQRVVAAKQANPHKRVVVIDTRRTASCDVADLFLQVRPGTDAALFGGLLQFLTNHGALDERYIAAHTQGLADALAATAACDLDAVSAATGLAHEALQTFYTWYANTPATVTLYSQGINQSRTGSDNCNAIINCHLATGRIGKPGAGPFSITGQPNAMGGREVGGLANQLAAHRGFDAQDVDAVGRFWRATDMASAPGHKAVDLFQAVERGEIKFLWIMATNPVVSLPDATRVARALQRCDFVVVSDCSADTATAQLADLLLPAAGWGEKAGTVTNSERVISRQRKFAQPPGEARPDWWIVTQVARRLGHADAFDYDSPAAIFREHAALSGFENQGARCFDISPLAGLSDDEYEALPPQRWPLAATGAAGPPEQPFADGRFPTPDGRARFVAVHPVAPAADGRFVVNTGRLRDQWHTMTRTGTVPRLSRHRDFFAISINPEDARELGLDEESLARLGNERGTVVGVPAPDPDLPRGQVWVPIHWSGPFAAAGRVNDLIAPLTDPVSGQPQSKFALAQLTREAPACWGMLFSRRPLELAGTDYWSRLQVAGGHLALLAHSRPASRLAAQLDAVLSQPDLKPVSYQDEASGDLRRLWLRGDDIDSAFFLATQRASLPTRDWLGTLGTSPCPGSPLGLLAGCTPSAADPGATVCSCWEVGEKQIAAEIARGATSVESLGERLRCGTQCGSCLPELKQLIQAAAKERAA